MSFVSIQKPRWQVSCGKSFPDMLKITIHDSSGELRFRLEGRLSGPWVEELRQSWRTGASTTEGRKTVLDLREVDFVDAPGQCLVAEMHRSGVHVVAITPLIQALVAMDSAAS